MSDTGIQIPEDGEWHVVQIIRENGVTTIYIDGVKVSKEPPCESP